MIIAGKEYSVKREIKFGEYRKINAVNMRLGEITKRFQDDLSAEDMDRLNEEFSQVNNDQLQIVVEFLEDVIGLKQKDIDNLSLAEAIIAFQEGFKEATTVKKN